MRPLQHARLVVRMKSARPALFGLVQCEAGVVEGGLVKEVGVPLGSGTPDQRRDCVDDQSKAIFGLQQRSFNPLLVLYRRLQVIAGTPESFCCFFCAEITDATRRDVMANRTRRGTSSIPTENKFCFHGNVLMDGAR